LNKTIPMEIMGELIKEKLEQGGNVKFTPKGNSMLPMLRNNIDTVVLKKNDGKLKKYDLPLYQRKDETYVLHRVVKVKPDGSYLMRGDNQLYTEQGITDEDIVGVVTEFIKDGKTYTVKNPRYRAYCIWWVNTYSFRVIYKRTRRFLGRVKRRFFCKSDLR